MSKVKYFYDLLSQPSRALWIALQMGKIPYEDCPVALRKLEQRTEAFKKINRFQKVPCIVDGDFHLSESVAILRYLSDKGLFCEKLYPKDIKERARVDEFLEWQHLSIRYGCAFYFARLWLYPMRGMAEKPTAEEAAKFRKEMETHLKYLETMWLNDRKFVSGNALTVADLFGACEIEQTKICNYDVTKKFPKITDWLARVREESNPFYDEGHKYVEKLAAFNANNSLVKDN
ncbi:glutathione S-transferase theta-1-like [Musca vetustissima]|uniref:glutathione S-transferase theta-1-like n=1 Tax=Musca vetustissima TaxID=27455 RepID=UPI002AB6F4D4|nr:glutathione S-transferase theta-1-like [Musca vetustissima]XP_061401997.1 glutathione S-transferase theta-1-like [Musca vetustissima]